MLLPADRAESGSEVGAVRQPHVFEPGSAEESAEVPVDDPEPGLGVDAVMDGEVAWSADGPGEVDALRDPHPRCADRGQEDVDRLVKILGTTGVNAITRVLGILLAALAVQFVLDGLVEGLHLG